MNKDTRGYLTKALNNLVMIGSIIMIIALFSGAFFKDDGGIWQASIYPGYKLIFNGDYMLGTLLILLPALVLIAKFFTQLKSYVRLIDLVLPLITLAFVFVLKNQIASNIGGVGSEAHLSLAFGAWFYLLGNVLAVAGGISEFFSIDLNKKVDEVMKNKESK